MTLLHCTVTGLSPGKSDVEDVAIFETAYDAASGSGFAGSDSDSSLADMNHDGAVTPDDADLFWESYNPGPE